MTGIDTTRVKISAFVLSAVCALPRAACLPAMCGSWRRRISPCSFDHLSRHADRRRRKHDRRRYPRRDPADVSAGVAAVSRQRLSGVFRDPCASAFWSSPSDRLACLGQVMRIACRKNGPHLDPPEHRRSGHERPEARGIHVAGEAWLRCRYRSDCCEAGEFVAVIGLEWRRQIDAAHRSDRAGYSRLRTGLAFDGRPVTNSATCWQHPRRPWPPPFQHDGLLHA